MEKVKEEEEASLSFEFDQIGKCEVSLIKQFFPLILLLQPSKVRILNLLLLLLFLLLLLLRP